MTAVKKTLSTFLLVLTVVTGLSPAVGQTQERNHALQFAGDDFVRMGTIDLSGDEVTISAWVKPFRFPNTLHTIAGIERSGEAAALLRVGDQGVASNRPQFVLRIEGRQVKVNASETLETGVWQHVAGSYDGRKMMIFVDGKRAGEKEQSGQVEAQGVFRVSKSFGGRYFSGLIDEVRVWRGARYDAFIYQSRKIELAGNESGLEGYWRFNDGMGSSVEDHTGNGHHGTITGAGWTRSAAPVKTQGSGGSSTTEEGRAASGFRVHFSRARYSYVQNANPQFILQGSLLEARDWRVRQMKEYLYHLQVPGWQGHFWKINTSRRRAYLVEEGTFGKYGGTETDLNVQVDSREALSSNGFRLDFSNLSLHHAPGKTQLVAGGTNPQSPLSFGNAWEVERLNQEIFHVRERTWQDHFWQVNIEGREVYEVKAGTFGEFGGQTESLDAEVERVK